MHAYLFHWMCFHVVSYTLKKLSPVAGLTRALEGGPELRALEGRGAGQNLPPPCQLSSYES